MGWSDLISAGSDFLDVGGDILDVGGDLASFAGDAYGIYSALWGPGADAADRAEAAAGLQEDMAKFQRAQAIKRNEIGQETANTYQDAIQSYYDSLGGAGMYDPQTVSDLAAFYENEFQDERGWVQQNINDLLMGSEPGIQGKQGEYMGGQDAFGTADYMGMVPGAAPDYTEGNYDQLVNELATGYYDTFARQADRAIAEVYGNQRADSLRRGLGRSTYDIESKKAASSQAARMRDEAVTKAVNQALSHAGKRQGMDVNNLSARMNSYGGELDRSRMGITAGSQGVADRIRSATATADLDAAAHNTYWDNLNAAGGFLGTTEGLRPGDTAQAYDMATSQVGKNMDLRNAGEDQIFKGVTRGPSYWMDAMSGASNMAANAGSSVPNFWNNRAMSSAYAMGQGLEGARDWGSLFD